MTAPEVTQIKIGKHLFGIIGLADAIADVAAEHADKPEDELARLLVDRLGHRNYIPANVKQAYGQAFVREYKKAQGQAVDEADEGLVIKVLGAGCNVCDSLENTIMETLADL